MGLILSIPQKVKADGTYYNVSATTPISISTKLVDTSSRTFNFEFVYSDPGGEYPIPSNTQISFDALTYVVQAMHNGNVLLFANQGIAIDWFLSDTFSLLFNAAMALGQMADYYVIAPHTIEYYIIGFDTEWITYRFMYLGVWVDITLTPSGDFTYTTENGRQEHVSNIRHHSATENLVGKAIQDQGDPTANKINTPYFGLKSFSNLDLPYIDGKELHFFVYTDNIKHEFILSDFTETTLCYNYLSSSTNAYCYFIFIQYPNDDIYPTLKIDGSQVTTTNRSRNFNINNENIVKNVYMDYIEYKYYFGTQSISFNLPGYKTYTSQNLQGNYNYSGYLNNTAVNEYSNIYLSSINYSPIAPQYRPEVPLDLPIPTDQVIIYPETELPQEPDGNPVQPDPFVPSDPIDVPGVPVNPTPPIFRPLPSIVSGNDDLWPSVVELENIEIDLGGYISGLDEYEFPDLSSITSSFSGAIVWVSTIMSTLFNGSDFSILFAVLSSFFIVAALLGLYKWWNHK